VSIIDIGKDVKKATKQVYPSKQRNHLPLGVGAFFPAAAESSGLNLFFVNFFLKSR
jgi:hypothetical protein